MKFQLKPDNRNASDEELLKDLSRAAFQLGLQPIKTRDYNKIGRFDSRTIARRFHGWNAALEKAGLKTNLYKRDISDKELIEDLERVQDAIAPKRLTQDKYNQKGIFTSGTIHKRFGGWNKALEKTGLEVSVQQNITEKELFSNIEQVWINLGHQPTKREISKPYSKYSERPYINKYGSWRKSLEAFVEYINSDNKEVEEMKVVDIRNDIPTSPTEKKNIFKHKTKRDISEKLKVRVLIRDGNKCRLCKITVTGDNIHFDHIKPWSKGGETVVENIQILCAKHNLAKGDFYEEN